MTPKLSNFSRFLVILAGAVLLISSLSNRAERIAFSTNAFLSGEFLMVLAVALVTLVVSVWLSMRALPSPIALWAFIALGSMGVAALYTFAEGIRTYSTPFVLWAVIINSTLLWHLVSNQPSFQNRMQNAINFVGATILLLLVLEGVLRVWFTVFGTETDRVNYVYSVDEVLNKYNRFRGEPYVNFGLSPNHPDHNARGYRSPELTTPKPDGTFRIFAIGGSTTYGISLINAESYPTQLQRILRDEYGYTNVEVINAGVPQYATYENLINFQLKILDDEPDMLITYEGINDVVTRLVDPAFYTGENPMRGIWDTSRITRIPFVLVRFVGANTGLLPRPGVLDSAISNVSNVQRCTDATFCENLGLSPVEVLEANPPRYFERNLRHLVILAQANDVQVVMSTWAYYPEESNGSLYMTYPQMQMGANQHNVITQALAEEYDLPLIDFAQNVPYDADLWQDGLHLSAKGAEEQARQYARFLVDNDLLPKP